MDENNNNVDTMGQKAEQKSQQSRGKDVGQKAQQIAKVASKLKNVPALLPAIGIILLIILMIGLLSSFLSMPGMFLENVKKAAKSVWHNILTFIDGNVADRVVSEEDEIELAQRINAMGYDIVGSGFTDVLAYNENDVPTELGQFSDGRNYLRAYLVANESTYTLAKWSLAGGFKSYFDFTTTGEDFSQGMINVVGDDSIPVITFDPVLTGLGVIASSFLNSNISIDRESETLVVEPKLAGSFFKDTYYFDLSTWTTRYGRPVELMLALHLSTMMPDLTYDLSTMQEFNTKVDIDLSRVNVTFSVQYNGVTIEPKGTWEFKSTAIDRAKTALEANGITLEDEQIEELVDLANDGQGSSTLWPRILEVRSHWYYNDFTFEYEDHGTLIQTMSYTANGDDDPLADIAGGITLSATINNTYYQIAEPVPDGPNTNIVKLFQGDESNPDKFPGEYYQFDGTRQTAQEIANAKAADNGEGTYTFGGQDYDVEAATIEKEPVNFNVTTTMPNGTQLKTTKNAFGAFSILEGMNSDAAEKVYRNLQDLLIELNYFTEEDFAVPSTQVLEWILPNHIPAMWPIRDVNEYGAFIRSEANIDDGFESGISVIAPGDATITEIGSNSIKLKLNAIDDDTLEELQEKLGEETNVVLDGKSVLDMEFLINGIDVDDSLAVSQEIKRGDTLGTTTTEDIHVIMYNKDKSIVDNIEDYMSPNYGSASGSLNISIQNDYVVSTLESSDNVIRDVDTFKRAFNGYDNIVANAQAFLNMQEQYGVNAVFAAAVTIAESSGGTNWVAIDPDTHNWFSIKYANGNWKDYDSFEEAIMDFGYLISGDYFGAGNYTITSICENYCGGSSTWSTNVSSAMTNALQKINNT